MDKAYDPKKYEENILKKWNDAKAFLPKTPAQSKTGKSFAVPIPPPNVTGTLHLGHAMMVVVEDIMTRYHRMKGDATLWLPGTDHAAIATESVVLKNLGVPSREVFSREEFLEKCFDHTKKSQATITNQVKKMGASCDFTRERYTMDLGLSNAVWKIFKDLYEHNLIVRGYRMVNWSTKAQSVLADDELEYEDKKEPFFYIKCGRFVMGTVRSETKCADSPLVIHPDENYVVARFFPENSLSLRERVGVRDSEEFVFSEILFDDAPRRNKIFNQLGEGKWEKVSVHQGKFFEGEEFEAETFAGKRKFFVLCDAEVIDINKGTGAMTISVNHSADDYFLAKKYPEKLKNYYIEKIGLDGKMTKVAGELEGVEVEIARKRAAKMMTEKGILVGIDKDYVHNVPLCYRTGCVVEPMISPQWFIDVNKEFDWQENVGAIQNSKFKIQNEGKIIYFLRHGESEWNTKSLMQGRRENISPLTEKGREQAQKAGETLKGKNISKIFSSHLERAEETANIVAKELGITVKISHSLHEWGLGNYEGMTFQEAFGVDMFDGKKVAQMLKEKKLGDNAETIADLEKRCQEFWEMMEKETENNIVVVSHGAFIKILLHYEKFGNLENLEEAFEMGWPAKNGEPIPFVLQEKQNGNFEIYLHNISSLLQMEKEEGKIYSPHKKYAVGDVDDGTKKCLQTENTEIVISEFIYAKIKGWIPHLSGHNEIFESDFYFLPILLQNPLEIFEDTKTQYRYMVLPSFKGTRSFIVVLDGKKEKAEIVSFFYTNQKNKYAKEGDRFHQIQKRRESLEGPAIVPSCITSELRRELKRLVAGEGEPSFTSRQTLSHTEIIKFFTANQLLNLEPEIQNLKIIKTTLKKLTLEAITQHGGQTNIIPDRFVKIYDQWIENLQDWCISRQIWWGHQIPVWYDENGNEFVAHEQKILFARHGESEDNTNDIIGGNSSLTEKGKKQAEELAQKLILEGRNIKKIYCSSLKRSRQTAEIVAKTVGAYCNTPLHIEEFPEFHEIFAGDLENQKRIVEKKYPHTLHKMLDLKTGETLEELENRAKNFWKNISELSPEDGEILFVGHRSFLSMVFAVKDGRFGQTLVDYRDRWEMDKCEVKEVSWMMKPKMNINDQLLLKQGKSSVFSYEEYLKNIEELLKTEKKKGVYEKENFVVLGEFSEEIAKILEIKNKEVVISEFIFAKISGWIPQLNGHSEIENSDFYLLPYLLQHTTEIYENAEKNERYLITHAPHEEQAVILVVDTFENRNELVSYFFTTNTERYLNSLLEKNRYTKKRSLEGPTAPSCITTQLREDAKRLVVGFPSRQTPMYTDFLKFFQELQEKSVRAKDFSPLRQDSDTLDTWFSSALWPFSTLGWPDRTPDFEDFYPTSVLETGHDILFFWVARMIMFGRFATGKNPFKDVYLHGLVCDEHGKKMSKSKGNGIDPLEMIEKFGTDALRMALVVGTTPGNQVNLGEKKIEGFRNFANKIWNISRYIIQLPISNVQYSIDGNNSKFEIKKIESLEEKKFAHQMLKDELYGDEFDARYFDGELLKNTHSFIFLEKKEIIGCGQLWEFNPKQIALLNFVIKKEFQKQGKGQIYLEKLEEIIVQMGGNKIFTNADNDIYQGFYKKFGFQEEYWKDEKRSKESIPLGKKLYNNSKLSLPEQWILSKTQTLIAEISDGLENHKYGEVGQKLYDFAWNDVADWAIESAKAVESETIGNTLRYVLEILLKLLHPYMPFISEVIWEEMGNTNLLLLQEFPEVQKKLKNPEAEEQFLILQEVISSIRSLRSASKVDPVKKIVAILNGKNVEFLQENAEIIKLLARLETLQFDEKTEEKCVQDLVNGTEILLPLSGMLNEGLEKQRKEKELFEAKKLLQNLESRLNNEKYMASAPQNLVEQTRKQHAEVLEKIKILEG